MTPIEVINRFKLLTEEEKIACHVVDSQGPHFLFEGYKIQLSELANAIGG